MGDTLEYSYRMKAWKLLLAVFGCLAFAGVMGYIAHTNEAGLRLFRLITFSPATASAIYWVLAAICAGAGIVLLAALASGITRRTLHIRLTPTEFSAPAGWFRKDTLSVPLSEIDGAAVQTVNKVRFLQVYTARGKVAINQSDIGKAAFEELADALAGRIEAARGAG